MRIKGVGSLVLLSPHCLVLVTHHPRSTNQGHIDVLVADLLLLLPESRNSIGTAILETEFNRHGA